MNRLTGTVCDDPEEMNNYVKQQVENDVRESLEKIERDQQEARDRRNGNLDS